MKTFMMTILATCLATAVLAGGRDAQFASIDGGYLEMSDWAGQPVLVVRDGERYANAPGAEAFLVRGAKYDFGDYLRYQIDKQMYPFLQGLEGLRHPTILPLSLRFLFHCFSLITKIR